MSLSSEVTCCKPVMLKEIYCILYQVIFSIPMDFISIQDFYCLTHTYICINISYFLSF